MGRQVFPGAAVRSGSAAAWALTQRAAGAAAALARGSGSAETASLLKKGGSSSSGSSATSPRFAASGTTLSSSDAASRLKGAAPGTRVPSVFTAAEGGTAPSSGSGGYQDI